MIEKPAQVVAEDEWYRPPKGQPIRYLLCGECDYKSTTAIRLENHVERMHPKARLPLSSIKSSSEVEATSKKKPPAKSKVSSSRNAKSKQQQKSPGSSLTKSGPRLKLKCRECGFRTNEESYLANHKTLHVIKAAHQCPLCSYSVGNEGHLARHVKRDHPDGLKHKTVDDKPSRSEKKKEEDDDVGLGKERYKCDECDFSSSQQTNLKSHKKRHCPDAGDFKCSKCSYAARKKHFLDQHLERDHKKRRRSANLSDSVS